MQNMADAQHPDGAMPTTAPEYVFFEGPGLEPFAQSPEWGEHWSFSRLCITKPMEMIL